MSWVIKRGRFEYAFAGAIADRRVCDWTDDQTLAHRFFDRNEAANVVGHTQAQDDALAVQALYATAGQSGSHRIVSALRAVEAWLREGGTL